jgi:ABC-type polysaccharide/polyol phosphate export permease
VLGGSSAGAHRYWYPLAALVGRDVKKRYARSLLGAAWTVLQPAILIGIYTVVFGFVYRSTRSAAAAKAFVLYLLTGMLPYLAIAEACHRALGSLREDKTLLERETFPAEIVPASKAVTASVGEVVGLVLLVLVGPALGLPLTGWIALLPVLVALRLLFTFGLVWILGTLAVFVTDLSEGLQLILTCWLFLTPVFYSPADAPPLLRRLLLLNPLYALVQCYRHVLLEGRAPLPEGPYALAWAVAVAGAGAWFFRKSIDRAKDFL